MAIKPIVLMILDGWGLRDDCDDNAISLANPENFNRLADQYPFTSLKCSGLDVGLPGVDGKFGGRAFKYRCRTHSISGDYPYNECGRGWQLFVNPEFNAAIDYALENQGLCT